MAALIAMLRPEEVPEDAGGWFDTRYRAARALLFFDDPAAAGALRAAATDDDSDLRAAARLALRRLERLGR